MSLELEYKDNYFNMVAALQVSGAEGAKAFKASKPTRGLGVPLDGNKYVSDEEVEESSLPKKLLDTLDSIKKENKSMIDQLKDMDVDYGEESIPNRPAGAEYFTDPDLEDFSNTIKELKEDKRFSSKLAKLSTKYNISEREILMVGAKESSLMTNPSAKNMFQILATPAKEAGIDLNKLNNSKNPVDQLNALEKYLDRWNYADLSGSIPLGLIIAAPSARNQEKDFVVYKKGSKELEANPKWAGEDGNATVGSITKFYRGDE